MYITILVSVAAPISDDDIYSQVHVFTYKEFALIF